MTESEPTHRDIDLLVVRRGGRLNPTGVPSEPYQLIDAHGAVVDSVALFLRDLLAVGRAPATLRSYGMDLLRWWRFLEAVSVGWNQATHVEARDFSIWIQITTKKRRPDGISTNAALAKAAAKPPNSLTGKHSPGPGYAPSTVTHSETVLRTFYDFHRDEGTGPILNPFPLDPSRRHRRANEHHNPMDKWAHDRVGRYRPKVPRRNPRAIPDRYFSELFANLSSNRDRALVSFWISSGVRASELIGLRQIDVDPGQQLITVVRKGSRAIEQVPAAADAFVWLRFYQAEMQDEIASGRTQPLWWTLRRPWRPLTYHAAHRMFQRANAMLGSNWTLHDLRHSAAARMARDPEMKITDVQQILGHAHLSTTEIYLRPDKDEVLQAALAHYARAADRRAELPPSPAPGYDPQSLDVLFGRRR